MKFTLDSNVLVDAVRSSDAFDAYEGFVRWARRHLYLSAVVVAELEAGARTASARDRLERQFLGPLERRGRVLAPTSSDWRRAGRILAERPSASPSAVRQNDALLAVQAREQGWVLITRDRDFLTLRDSVPGLELAAPFPTPPRA